MSILLTVLAVIAGIIVLLLIIGLFSKKKYALHREIVINRPLPVVFDYLRHIRNQDHYNKWVMVDPAMKKEFSGTDGTAGFVYGWNGNKQAGEGEQEIMNVADGRRVDMQIRFKRPFKAVANSFVETKEATGGTNVKWHFDSAMGYPMNIMLLFMNMEKFLGKDLEISLNNLKTILEKK